MRNKKIDCPTDNQKNILIEFNADNETIQKLKEYSEKLKISQEDVLRQGIDKIYNNLKRSIC